MEQYWMPKKLDFDNLRTCLDNYEPVNLFIRLMGSSGGEVKVNEDLRKRKLDFKKNKSGLHMIVDDLKVFQFPLKDYSKGFSVSYERFELTGEGNKRLIALPMGENPYVYGLPEPEKSTLRTVMDDHLMEISFSGRIHLKFYKWWHKPHDKYWTIDLR